MELSPSREPETQSSELYRDILAYRVPLPVDEAIIVDYEYFSKKFANPPLPGYAFGGLPTWIARTIGELYDRLDKRVPIVTVDLCSSTPIYTQRLRANEFDRDGARGRELDRDLYTEDSFDRITKSDSSLADVFKAVQKNKIARQLLGTALQETLYQITEQEANSDLNGTKDDFRERLIEKIAQQSVVYDQELNRLPGEEGDSESRLRLKFNTVHTEKSYLDSIAESEIPDSLSKMSKLALSTKESNDLESDKIINRDSKELVGREKAMRFIRIQAELLVDEIVGNRRYKPARFLSLDISNPDDIGVSAIMNTPQDTKNTNLFTHALASLRDKKQHLVRSMFKPLPFPDNSISLITCFDGWPFHFQLDENTPSVNEPQMQLFDTYDRQKSWDAGVAQRFEDLSVDTLLGLYKKLAHGGKIVIFPWDIPGQNAEKKESLERILDRVAYELDEPITEQRIMRKTLKGFMSDHDLEIAYEQSPLLKYGNERFRPVIIEKPKLSSEKSRIVASIKRVSKAQTRG